MLVQTELLGPRRIEGARFVDNAESLLYTSDLVFMDPIETGFSRPEKLEFDEFLSTLGDFAFAEFIRAWRVHPVRGRHQPPVPVRWLLGPGG